MLPFPAMGSLRSALDTVGQAAATCAAHPLRTALGALSIAVAVGTLTLVEAAIDGLGTFARQSASRAFGSDTFVLAQIASPGQISRRELERKLARNPPVVRSDVRFLEAFAGDRVIYAASAQRAADLAAGERKFENASVTGTGHNLPEIRDLGLAQGRFFSAEEERKGDAVVVLGNDLATTLFPTGDPLGGTVRLARRAFLVVGVQTRLGTAGGVSLDRYAWIPLPTYERLFGAATTLQVSAKPPAASLTGETGGSGSEAAVLRAEDRARATMRARRQLAPAVDDTFDILTPEAARTFVLNIAQRIGAAAPLLGGMALLAAMVVIANTTLVSVAQRTFEIGVRRALGASRGRIVREVLSESVLVAVGGGLAGSLAIAVLLPLLSKPLGLALAVRAPTLAWALAAAALSGVLAGGYPARRAARIDVVTALRSD